MILALHHRIKHFTCSCNPPKDFPGGSVVKYLPANIGDIGSIPGLGRSPEVEKWQPPLVFLPGESHGQRSLADYSPWGRKVRHN